MLVDVAMGERLFDHHQAEGVELPEQGRVRERIVAVGVHHQREVRKVVAHGPDPLDVLPFLDFHLDAAVFLGHGVLDGGQQLGLRTLEADADAGHDPFGRPGHEFVKRPAILERDQVEESVLDGRLGHPVAPDVPEPPLEIAERDPRLDERQEEIFDDMPGRAVGLVEVERVGVGDALAPGGDAARLEAHEQRFLVRPGVNACPERGDERQLDGDEIDAVELREGEPFKGGSGRRADGHAGLQDIGTESRRRQDYSPGRGSPSRSHRNIRGKGISWAREPRLQGS